jgi:hypothetical protein
MRGNARLRDVTEADIAVQKRSKWRWLAWSLVLAVTALGSEYVAWIVAKPEPSQLFLVAGLVSTVIWFALLIFAAFRIRSQASWLLLSAPIALFGPAYVAWIIYQIGVGINDCEAREHQQSMAMKTANPHLDTSKLPFPPCGPDF